MKRYIRTPEYKPGDVVLEGDAVGYQCTIDISGDINKFPEELLEFVRRGYLHDKAADGRPIYRIELLTDEDHLFKENYDRFYGKIIPVLERAGFKIIDD